MDFAVAKIKKRDTFFIILADKTLFDDDFDFSNVRPYDDEYKLQDHEWFVLENFSKKKYCFSIFKEDFDSSAYSYLDRNDYEKTEFILSIQKSNFFMIQKITPSYIYEKQRALSWSSITGSSQAKLLTQKDLLVIKNIPDAIYQKDEDKLYFKNLNAITSVFEGINELYREATDQEVEHFLSLDIIQLDSNFNKGQVKTPNRRRIREAMDRYNNFSEKQKSRIPSYAYQYCPNIYNKEIKKFTISNEKDLTDLLYTINQRFYTTPIDKEDRIANSITKI